MNYLGEFSFLSIVMHYSKAVTLTASSFPIL